MEISYGIDYLYQSIGKLYVESEVYKQRLNAMEQQLRTALQADSGNQAAGGVDAANAVPSTLPHQAAPVDQDGAESSTAGVSDHAST